MTRRSRGCAAFVAFVACSTSASPPIGETRQEITNGSDDAADAAIVALVDANGAVVCSGTLISPHVVLTAAHCAIDATTYTQYRAYFGESPAGGSGTFVALSAALVHPQFDTGTLANDLALLVLASDVDVTPVAMLSPSPDATFSGATIRVVGFGRTGDAASGAKRSGASTVTAVTSTTFDLAPAPSLPCEGDSGGPGLLTVGTTSFLAGVTSHGDSACATSATDTRVDAYVASFVQPYLDAIAEGTAAAGARCLYPEQCSASACVVAADDASLAYCAPPCSASGACPSKMTCAESDAGRRCLYSLPTPGALGSTCANASDCVGGDCIAGGVCSARCVSGSGDCPSGFDCVNTSGIDFYCVATPAPSPASSSSSCGVVTGSERSESPWWMAIVVALLAATRASSRRRSRAR